MLGGPWHGRGQQEGVLGLGVPTGASQKWRLRVRQAVAHARLGYDSRTAVDVLQGILPIIPT